jgi:hypothetical protein
MHRVLLLLPLALAACGPDSAFNNLTCRNAMYADHTVKARIAATATPDTDPAVQQAKQQAYDACTANLPEPSGNASNVPMKGGVRAGPVSVT